MLVPVTPPPMITTSAVSAMAPPGHLRPTTEPTWVDPGGSARRPGVVAPRESRASVTGGYEVSPTNLTGSLPFRVSGVMAQVPLQVVPTILPAVFGPAIGKAKPLLTAPRMQKLAFTGA